MKKSETQFPDTDKPEYNQHDHHLPCTENVGAVRHVTVPPDPPEFGPAAARALLRLLTSVHRKRHKPDPDPKEAP